LMEIQPRRLIIIISAAIVASLRTRSLPASGRGTALLRSPDLNAPINWN